jgi:hypothetical protein
VYCLQIETGRFEKTLLSLNNPCAAALHHPRAGQEDAQRYMIHHAQRIQEDWKLGFGTWSKYRPSEQGCGKSRPLVIPRGTLRFLKSLQNGKVPGLDADKNAQKLAICPCYVAV